MAVSLTSSTASSGKNGTGTTITFTSFAVSGTNPAILVKIVMSDNNTENVTVSSVAVSAGLSASSTAEVVTTVGSQSGTDGTRVSIWKIVAPSGTGTITVTLSVSVAWQAVAELWAGADQTDPAPVADAVSVTGDAANPLVLTPANLTANDAASAMGGNGNAGDGPDFDQTETYKDNTTTVNASGGYHLGTGSVSCTWVSPSGVDVFAAVRVAAAAGGNSSSVSPSVSPSSSASRSVSPSVSPSSSVSRSVSPSVSPSSSVSSSASPSVAPPAFVERTVFVYID